MLICFESIFASISRRWVENGANILINLTNDAWYGKSSAPHQSWAMSLFRAVETRRSLVRSANTGISGFIDPLGRVKDESELFVPWAQAAEMPLVTMTSVCPGGYLIGPICAVLALVSVIFAGLGRGKTPQARARSEATVDAGDCESAGENPGEFIGVRRRFFASVHL